MPIVKPVPYSLEAYNTAINSENKMHDDTVAKQFGFTGGLVPGVDVYAYMSHVPLQVWGRAFLERGDHLVFRLGDGFRVAAHMDRGCDRRVGGEDLNCGENGSGNESK